MTEEDDLNPAKVREVVEPDGQLADRNRYLDAHTGFVSTELAESLSWSARAVPDLDQRESYREMVGFASTRQTTEAVHQGHSSDLAYQTGITEDSLSADSFEYTVELLDRVRNNGAPAFVLGFGNPNTGKTGHVLHEWYRAWSKVYPDGVAVSNARVPVFEERVTSAQELYEFLTEADRRVFVLIDEGSTHFDARTHSHEVATQWTPLAKRAAKLGFDVAIIGHTVMDVHPECKRLASTVFRKESKKQVQFFDRVDDDELLDPVFPAPVTDLEKPPERLYSPDDWSPWTWDLDPDVLRDPAGGSP